MNCEILIFLFCHHCRQNGEIPPHHRDSLDKRTGFTANSVLSSQHNDGSIKSASSYDASKISFQGKRALFESGVGPNKTKPSTVESSGLRSSETLPTLGASMSDLETRNKSLEEEIVRLEQSAVVKEELVNRLRDKLDKVEKQMIEQDKSLRENILMLTKENDRKDELIQ